LLLDGRGKLILKKYFKITYRRALDDLEGKSHQEKFEEDHFLYFQFVELMASPNWLGPFIGHQFGADAIHRAN
jgi:hypothetical protein